MSPVKQPPLLPQDLPNSDRRVQVLVPYPLARAYDYSLPDGMKVNEGDYVEVTLGKKRTEAVVWLGNDDATLDPAKLKPIIKKYAMPPMPAVHRQFIDWVARYTMSDMGSVLKMSLSASDVFDPPKASEGYIVGTLPTIKIKENRQKVLSFLSANAPMTAADITRETGVGASVIKAMRKDGLVNVVSLATPAPCQLTSVQKNSLQFSDQQQDAANALIKMVQGQKYSAALLDGVTGAGKTEVYFEAVAETLRQGKQVLILLPEISLSAQFLERFERRFGMQPALWHSEVTPAQRRITWRGVAMGETRVVVGARSALFLPYADLGLIVVDEEHDASYKQEEGVLYHARDMAIVRAHLGALPIVLVSATPSLETMQNVRLGKYHYLHLASRHAGAKMPDVKMIDLRKSRPSRGKFLAPALQQALQETFTNQEQSLLFLNRRGYAPLTLCRTCGHRFQCPSCSAWLVEHRKHHRLQCHHCGHSEPMPKSCPSCDSTDSLVACGPGVERIQEEVQELLPDARTVILASDLLSNQKMLTKIVGQIENHEIDVIIGTQIIAKGHHFPSLTCVGVVDADLGMSGGDLRAGERTFQLLHQVAGRAGRAEKAGRVFLQTYMPEQTVMQALAGNDRDRFIDVELREREKGIMPPYGKLAGLILSCPDEIKLDQFCRLLSQKAPRFDDIRVLGPAPAPMAFLRGKHRRRFLVKAEKSIAVQKFLQEWLEVVKIPTQIQLKIDIDPQSFY